MVLTPQVFLNMLDKGVAHFSQIDLLVRQLVAWLLGGCWGAAGRVWEMTGKGQWLVGQGGKPRYAGTHPGPFYITLALCGLSPCAGVG